MNYLRKREGINQVANGLRLRSVSDLHLGGAGDFEDPDFYGVRNDFVSMPCQRKLELGGELTLNERDLETYGEEAQEWKEAQLHYENVKRNIERQISLGIGFVELGDAE